MFDNINNGEKKAVIVFFISLLVWILIYHNTLMSMVQIWWRSETFTHGFLILPISLYLIWIKREQFNLTEKNTSLFFSLCLLIVVLIWGLAKSVDVQVIQQFTIVLMIPMCIGALFGFKLLKKYLFPIAYLLFAVPFGEFLIPKLQDITATMTVFGLQISGVPVFTEGMFISIPEGDFEVAVACSGIRYLIASLALGTLYAYLNYTRLYKQLLFVLASLVIPILANGLRAYGIVMIAHLSDMKYATGVDHLIYGWLFFGVVIFILFYIGSFWQDKAGINVTDSRHEVGNEYGQNLFSMILPIVILFMGPAMLLWINYVPSSDDKYIITAPNVNEPWIYTGKIPSSWQPSFKNADSDVSTIYLNIRNNTEVYYHSSDYQYESQDKELVNAVNEVFSTKKWVLVSNKLTNITPKIKLEEHVLRSHSGKLLIWSWYEVLDFTLTNPVYIKAIQAFGKLLGVSRGGQFKAIAIPFYQDVDQAREQLTLFLLENNKILNKVN